MKRTFVNTKKKISGDSFTETNSKKSGKVLLTKESQQTLEAIGINPNTKVDKNEKIITFYDSDVALFKLNKNKLIVGCQAKMESDKSLGVEYLVPIREYAIDFGIDFSGDISVEGDISGLIFWF